MLILLDVLSNNQFISIAATVLLLMRQTVLVRYTSGTAIWRASIILLTVGVLGPLVLGKTRIPSPAGFVNWQMLAAVSVGCAGGVAGRARRTAGERSRCW